MGDFSSKGGANPLPRAYEKLKENLIGSVVSEILQHRQTHRHPVT